MAELFDWDVNATNNNSAPPDGFPENMAYSEVNNAAREVMAVLARYYDSQGYIVTGGTANALTLTVPQTISALASGMHFRFSAAAANTGPATLNVNGLGAVSLRARSNEALLGGEIAAGGIYSVVYNGTVFLIENVARAATTLALGGTDAVDLTDADAVLVVGPGTAQHVEHDTSRIQSKSNATTAAILNLNPLGGDVRVGAQSGAGSVELYEGGALVLTTQAAGVQVRDASGSQTELDLATDAGIVQTKIISTAAATIIRGVQNGGTVDLQATDTGAVLRPGVSVDPDVGVSIAALGATRLKTLASGVARLLSNASTDAEPRVLQFAHADDTIRGRVGHASAAALVLRNEIHGGAVHLEAEDAGGTLRSLVVGDPDGEVEIYHAGALTARTRAGGVQIIQSGGSDPIMELLNSAASRRAYVLASSTVVTVASEIHGAPVQLRGEDSGGTSQLIFSGDPDGAATIYRAGVPLISSPGAGVVSVRSAGNTDAEDRYIVLEHANAADRATIGHAGSDVLIFRNQIHGAAVALQGEDSGGVVRPLVNADPDGGVDVYYAGGLALSTQLWTATGNTSGAQLKDHAGNDRDIGFNDVIASRTNASFTLGAQDAGAYSEFDDGSNYTITLEASTSTDFPVGATHEIQVAGAGTISVNQGTGTTLNTYDGSAVTAGNQSLTAGALVRVHRVSTTEYRITGAGV